MKLKDQLPKLMNFIPVDNPYCNHVDLLWSKHVTTNVNDPVKEILKNADVMSWIYPGPNPYVNIKDTIDNDDRTSYPKTDFGDLPGLEFSDENLDALIRDTMPKSLDDNDTEEFERQRKLLNIVLRNMINFAVSVDTENRKSQQVNISNAMSNWVDNVKTNFLKGFRGV